jgi:hypothetical protein
MKLCKLASCLLLVLLCLTYVTLAADTPSLTFKFKTYSVPGALQTWLTGVNNSGVIAGWYADSQANFHGFTLTDGKFKQIDDPSGDQTEIWGINSSGDLVGFYHDPCIEELCYEGFIYHAGQFTNIGPPWFRTPPEDDAPDSEGFGINDSGTVVGSAGAGFGGNIGFVLQNHKYKKLQVPQVNGGGAVGINNAGLVTLNWATNKFDGASVYDGKTYKNIDVPNSVDSYASGINNVNDVVLAFDPGIGKPIHGALLHAGKYYKFFFSKGKNETYPLGLNDKHTIVGVWTLGGSTDIHVHGFIATY